MLRYEPEFRCGKVCNQHNTGTEEYIKRELDTFGCSYIPEAAYTATMSALAAARAADYPKDSRKPFPSTGGLAVFALAPSCAEVHSYGFTVPKPPYRESRVRDMEGEHEAFRAVSPKPCGISSASPVMLSVEAVMHHHGFCVSLAVCL